MDLYYAISFEGGEVFGGQVQDVAVDFGVVHAKGARAVLGGLASNFSVLLHDRVSGIQAVRVSEYQSSRGQEVRLLGYAKLIRALWT